jgi:hypothetical protein
VAIFESQPYYSAALGTTEGFFYERNVHLKKQIDTILKEMRVNLNLEIRNGMTESWGLSNVKNDTMVGIMSKGAGVSGELAKSFSKLNLTAMREFINRIDPNGLSVSKRIWNVSKAARYQLEQVIAGSVLTGQDAVKTAREITKYMNGGVSTVYQNGTVTRAVGKNVSYQALRLARTEQNMAFHMSDYKRRQQLPFVTGIEVYLSDSHPIFDVCDEMQGRYPKNFIFTGWHPSCLCYSQAVMLNDREFIEYIKNDTIRDNRYVRTIPAKAQKYVDDRKDKILRMKNKPYFIRDNFNANLKPYQKVLEVSA